MKSDNVYFVIILVLIGGIASWLFFYKLPNIDSKLDDVQKLADSSNTGSFDKELGSIRNQINTSTQETNKALNQHAERVTKIEKELAILTAALNTKFPDLNLPELIASLALSQKNASVQDFNIFFLKYQNSPNEAKAYLRDQWQIKGTQLNGIFSPPGIIVPQQKLQIKNPSSEYPARTN